jgi:hypothetical protein
MMLLISRSGGRFNGIGLINGEQDIKEAEGAARKEK